MNSKEWNEWKGEETPLDRELDEVLAQSMEVSVPEGLIGKTLKRLPELGSAPFAWWAWAAYVAFFTTAVAGLAYWEWETLVAAMTRVALVVPKIVALFAQDLGEEISHPRFIIDNQYLRFMCQSSFSINVASSLL